MNETRDRLLLPVLLPVGILVVIVGAMFGFSRVLLSVRASAATGVAIVVAAGILASASWVAGRKRVGTAALAALVTAVAGIAMLAGGIAIAAIGPERQGPGGKPPVRAFALTITAPSGAATAGFAETKLTVPADTPLVVTFDNQDPSVQHNVAIYSTKDYASGTDVFTGALTTGPTSIDYQVPAMAEGVYHFRCEIHPITMTGTIEAKAGLGASPTSTGTAATPTGTATPTQAAGAAPSPSSQ